MQKRLVSFYVIKAILQYVFIFTTLPSLHQAIDLNKQLSDGLCRYANKHLINMLGAKDFVPLEYKN